MQVITGFIGGLEFVQLGCFSFSELILLEIISRKTLEVNYNDDFEISGCWYQQLDDGIKLMLLAKLKMVLFHVVQHVFE